MTIEEIKEYNDKKIKELIADGKRQELQAQKAFEKRIDREWKKHVKKCVKKGTVITGDFIMKVRGDRLPYDMEHEEYSYTSDNGTFRVAFERSGLSWFRTVYYYIVQNMDITWD
jgi:hypothetical protein